jgi:DNA polymerase-3 subunit delta'
MNKEAGNALLKILEEPVGPTIHLLISHESDSLLPTIKSRCQILKFLPVSKKLIEDLLKKKVNQDQAEEMKNLAMGRPGLAWRFMQEQELVKNYNQESEAFLHLISQNIAYRLEAINSALGQEYSYNQLAKKALGLLNNWQRVLRDLILVKNNNKNWVVNAGLFNQLEKIGQKFSLANLLKMQFSLKEARQNIKLNVNPKLVLENFIINI